jgi:hypothetical protein
LLLVTKHDSKKKPLLLLSGVTVQLVVSLQLLLGVAHEGVDETGF